MIFFLLFNLTLLGQVNDKIFLKEDLLKIKPIGNVFHINKDDFFFKKEINLKFLATWCPKCQEDIKNDYLSKKKYIYIFGNYGKDNEESVSAFLSENPHITPAYFDTDNYLRNKFNISKVPFTVSIKN